MFKKTRNDESSSHLLANFASKFFNSTNKYLITYGLD